MAADIPGLKALYDKSPAGRVLFDWFAGRRYDSSATKVDRALAVVGQRGLTGSRAEVTEFFRSLEQLGCGKYRVGRRGWPSRFEWSVSLVSVGRAAAGEGVRIEEPAPDPVAEAEEEAEEEMLQHTFILRRELPISMNLPADLTEKEAGRLADFIRTLPIQSGD